MNQLNKVMCETWQCFARRKNEAGSKLEHLGSWDDDTGERLTGCCPECDRLEVPVS